MRKHFICSFSLFIASLVTIAQTNTTSDGNWNTGGNWDNGVPANGDVANITNQMTLNKDLTINDGTYTVDGGSIIDAVGGTAYSITISGSGYFEVGGDVTIEGDLDGINSGELVVKGCDTLTIGGDVEFRNNSQFIIESCGVLIIEGDLNLRNNHSSEVDGNIVVKGNLNSRNNAVIIGTGNIDVIGTIDINNSSSIFGNTSDCTPGPCSYGPGGSLPIELLSFETTAMPDGTIQINWITISETNNEYFSIERANGKGAFIELSRIEGAGNSQQRLIYQYTDDSPITGDTYYRLKQTDFDGKFTYSETRLVKANRNQLSSELHFYPNPANQKLTVENTFDSASNLKIMNASGMLILQETIQEGMKSITLDISSLPVGLYFISHDNQMQFKTAKLIVNR